MRSSTVTDTLEILDLRHYTSADLRELLQEETAAWARDLSWDYRGSAEMILRYIESKILPGYAALEAGRLIGYSFFVYEGNKGVIGDLFVAPQVEKQQHVQMRLLEHTIETLQQSPGIHRIEAQLLLHESGAVAAPFLRESFKPYRRLFMGLRLPFSPLTAPQSKADVIIRRWTDSDFQPAAALITQAYHGHVDSLINDQYRSSGGSLRFLNNIVRFPGCGIFDPGSSYVATSRSKGSLIGLLLCSRVRDDVGHVTQVCVRPEFRNLNIGNALIYACARDLSSRRFTQLSLTVTEENAGAVELYKRLGFSLRRVFDAFVWEG